jgi:hypothetical protein
LRQRSERTAACRSEPGAAGGRERSFCPARRAAATSRRGDRAARTVAPPALAAFFRCRCASQRRTTPHNTSGPPATTRALATHSQQARSPPQRRAPQQKPFPLSTGPSCPSPSHITLAPCAVFCLCACTYMPYAAAAARERGCCKRKREGPLAAAPPLAAPQPRARTAKVSPHVKRVGGAL